MEVEHQRFIEGKVRAAGGCRVRSFVHRGPDLLAGLGIALLILFLSAIPFQAIAQDQPKALVAIPSYLNPDLPIDERVNDLVSRMTLDEKISQMQDRAAPIPRLGIPNYNWWNEALHGVARSGHATVFPQAIGLAATWDTQLLHGVADVISTEARAKYNDAIQHGNTEQYYGLTFWSPNINIFRDPRWGRGQETYGEDPFLTARMGVAFVTGLQGNDSHYLKLVSTPKHYAVHSGPEALRNHFNVPVSQHDLADTYTPAFRATVVEGKAASMMCAYSAVRGTPACASRELFDLARERWGFDGYVVSDCGAIADIYRDHGYVASLPQAAALALKTGTDLDCGHEYAALRMALADRLVAVEDIDRAVKRLFEARFRLGMFDPPDRVPWSKLIISDNDTAEHRQAALEAARESIVLLKNENGTLPLKPSIKTIAVVGPNADSLDILLGNYNGTPSRYVTLLDGIKQRFPNAKIVFSPGATLTETMGLPISRECLRTREANSQAGLNAEYFANPSFSGTPVIRRVDAQLNFDWNDNPPFPGPQYHQFSVRWQGQLVPPETGDYRIGAASEGSLRLYLDGKLVVDDSERHSERTLTRLMHLEGGHGYAVRVEYSGNASARFVWQPPYLVRDAVAAAQKADVVIAVVGISPQLEGEENSGSHPGFFGGDRVDLDLPRPQEELLEKVATAGKPLVVVLANGSALAVNWAEQHAAAILEAWYPGEEGGTAVADVLAGVYNPAGRLPVTFYKSVAQLPPFGSYSMRGRTYRYFNEEPLYAFGYGLSFTRFRYDDVRVDSPEGDFDGNVLVSARVTNTGSIAGEEVAQLYVTRPDVEGTPLRALSGFTRIPLAPGASETVRFTLRERELSTVDAEGVRRIVPGTVKVWVGSGQPIATPGRAPTAGAETEFIIARRAVLPD